MRDADDLTTWLASRPAVVQQAAARWPLGSSVVVKGETFMVIGWSETADSDRTHDPLDLMLIMTPLAAALASYEESIAHREYLCARHLGASSLH